MGISDNVLGAAMEIRALARRAVRGLPPSSDGQGHARIATMCPVDYMRYAEFDAVLRELKLAPGMKVLDVSSPQWLSIFLASRYPDVHFTYANILESEMRPFSEIAASLGLANMVYEMADVRKVRFDDGTFDRVISVSVIEHIDPEVGGDVQALTEIRRVLKNDGVFLLTVPFKAKRNVVYVDGAVYERGATSRNFYAREYDDVAFSELIIACRLELVRSWYIVEGGGLFPVDYYEWGPGKRNVFMRYLMKSRKLVSRCGLVSLDEWLAKRYLSCALEAKGRLVNICGVLSKM